MVKQIDGKWQGRARRQGRGSRAASAGGKDKAECKRLVVKCIHFIIGIMFTKPINTGNRFAGVVIVSLRFVLLDDSY